MYKGGISNSKRLASHLQPTRNNSSTPADQINILSFHHKWYRAEDRNIEFASREKKKYLLRKPTVNDISGTEISQQFIRWDDRNMLISKGHDLYSVAVVINYLN